MKSIITVMMALGILCANCLPGFARNPNEEQKMHPNLFTELQQLREQNRIQTEQIERLARKLEETSGVFVSKKEYDETRNRWSGYGKVNIFMGVLDNGVHHNTRLFDSGSSRLGFKGSYRISDAWKAVWQLESSINGIDHESGASTLATRDSYIGFKNDEVGTFRFGISNTPYKVTGKKLNPYPDNVGDYTGIVAGSSGSQKSYDERLTGVFYDSPKLKQGFNWSVSAHHLSESDIRTPAGPMLPDERVYSGGFEYLKDNWTLFGAHEAHHNVDGARGANTGGNSGSASKVGLIWKNKRNQYGLMWDTIRVSNATTAALKAQERDSIWAAWEHYRGKQTYKLGYGQAGDGKALAGAVRPDNGATMMVLGLDQKLSKEITWYVTATQIKNDAAGMYGFTDPDGTAADYRPGKAGAKLKAIGTGFIYSF